MDAMLLSLIAGILYGGFVFMASNVDGDDTLIGLPFLAVIAAIIIFFCSLFLWRYEFVLVNRLGMVGIAQEGDYRTFASGTSTELYMMHGGQWVPNMLDEVPEGTIINVLQGVSGSIPAGKYIIASDGSLTPYSGQWGWNPTQ